MNRQRVLFSTREYESNHGARPRGRGLWGFIVADKWNANNYLDYVKWFPGTYGEAKRAAAKAFAADGISDVVVCS